MVTCSSHTDESGATSTAVLSTDLEFLTEKVAKGDAEQALHRVVVKLGGELHDGTPVGWLYSLGLPDRYM